MRKNFAKSLLCLSFVIRLMPTLCGYSAIPAPEKLLPDDTLVVATAPDFIKLRSVWENLPQRQVWNDPAMKPFRDSFLTKWKDEFVKPLERELDIKWDDYTSLLQGQVTLALTQNGWDGGNDVNPGVLLLLDTKEKSNQLSKNLTSLKKKWVDGGRPIKTTKIGKFEFTTLPFSTNDFPKTLRKFFPRSSPVQELGDENGSKPPPTTDELIIGQVESLLVLTSSSKSAEKVVARVAGGAVPPLADVATYQADYASLFRDAPLYGWVNLKVLMELFTRKLAQKKDNPDAPNPFDIKPDKILMALGLGGLKTVAFNLQALREGPMGQVFFGVPESTRQGIFRILAGEPRESRPPPFVPAEAVKFQRWRIDGQKTWETLQKMINDVSPQWLSGINFLLETANTAAREKDPGFDFKKNLIENLGDDFISYEKAPHGNILAELRTPPSLFLVASPNAEALSAGLKNVMSYMSQQAGAPPEEREFLGRKICSVQLRAMMGPLGAGGGANMPRTLSFSASGGYVAFSSDAGLVEEYLRSSEGQRNALRETPGLIDAAQKVIGPGSSLFGYENQVETTRTTVEWLRKNAGTASGSPAGVAASLVPSGLNLGATIQSFKDLMDFSLLPSFDSISKYFYFSVYGGGATVDGLSFKVFSPIPPGIKTADAPAR